MIHAVALSLLYSLSALQEGDRDVDVAWQTLRGPTGAVSTFPTGLFAFGGASQSDGGGRGSVLLARARTWKGHPVRIEVLPPPRLAPGSRPGPMDELRLDEPSAVLDLSAPVLNVVPFRRGSHVDRPFALGVAHLPGGARTIGMFDSSWLLGATLTGVRAEILAQTGRAASTAHPGGGGPDALLRPPDPRLPDRDVLGIAAGRLRDSPKEELFVLDADRATAFEFDRGAWREIASSAGLPDGAEASRIRPLVYWRGSVFAIESETGRTTRWHVAGERLVREEWTQPSEPGERPPDGIEVMVPDGDAVWLVRCDGEVIRVVAGGVERLGSVPEGALERPRSEGVRLQVGDLLPESPGPELLLHSSVVLPWLGLPWGLSEPWIGTTDGGLRWHRPASVEDWPIGAALLVCDWDPRRDGHELLACGSDGSLTLASLSLRSD